MLLGIEEKLKTNTLDEEDDYTRSYENKANKKVRGGKLAANKTANKSSLEDMKKGIRTKIVKTNLWGRKLAVKSTADKSSKEDTELKGIETIIECRGNLTNEKTDNKRIQEIKAGNEKEDKQYMNEKTK